MSCKETIVELKDGGEQCESFVRNENRNKDASLVLNKQNNKRIHRAENQNARRLVRRLVRKSGKTNVTRSQLPNSSLRYLRDFANTLVDSRWRWTLLSLSASFILSWLVFASFYMLASNSNGDLEPSPTPCLIGIGSFSGYFLFSIETQTSIGYGSRSITDYCPESIFLMCFQIILGCAICGGMASIVLMKMTRPVAIHSNTLFSKKALICQRDGTLCLIFRVRDDRNRHIVGTSIKAHLVKNHLEEAYLKAISLEPHGILIWPLEVVHKINESSPFWDVSAKDLVSKRFELVVTMRGTSAVTGQCSKTKTSYLSTEILWGHRFQPCVFFDNEKCSYYVDHREFNKTDEVLTPLCSGQRLREVLTDTSNCLLTFKLNHNGATPKENVHETDENQANFPSDDIDEEIYSFLREIKEKLNYVYKRRPNYHARSLNRRNDVVDVENLLEKLETSVSSEIRL